MPGRFLYVLLVVFLGFCEGGGYEFFQTILGDGEIYQKPECNLLSFDS